MDVMLPLPPDTNGNPEHEGCVCISADGKTVVVGSMGINPCVCVFYRTNDEWVLNTKIEPTNGLTGENIYGHCVVLSGNGKTIAFGGAVNKKERGFVSIYCLIESEWVKQTELNDFTHNVSGGFSESLVINFAGDILVVGSPCYSGAPVSVYVFSSQTGKWEIEAIFEPNSDGFINSFFGDTLSINKTGDVIAVGSPWQTYECIGSVYVFVKGEDNKWVKQTTIQPKNIGTYVYFGYNTCINDRGDILVVTTNPDTYTAGVFIYELIKNEWCLLQVLESCSDGQLLDPFAQISNDVIFVEENNNDETSCVYIFTKQEGKYKETKKILFQRNSNDISINNSGTSLAISLDLGNNNSKIQVVDLF